MLASWILSKFVSANIQVSFYLFYHVIQITWTKFEFFLASSLLKEFLFCGTVHSVCCFDKIDMGSVINIEDIQVLYSYSFVLGYSHNMKFTK